MGQITKTQRLSTRTQTSFMCKSRIFVTVCQLDKLEHTRVHVASWELVIRHLADRLAEIHKDKSISYRCHGPRFAQNINLLLQPLSIYLFYLSCTSVLLLHLQLRWNNVRVGACSPRVPNGGHEHVTSGSLAHFQIQGTATLQVYKNRPKLTFSER